MLAGAIVRTVAPADVALRSSHRAELRIERNTDLLLCHVITSLSMPPRFMTGAAGALVAGAFGSDHNQSPALFRAHWQSV